MWRSPSRSRNSKGVLQVDKYPYEVQQKLRVILKQTDEVAWLFSKNPTKDFSRHRKLPFHKLAEILIGMEGGSLSHEMLNCFHFSRQTPSVPAFIQQRTKLLPDAMAFVFSEVVKAFPCGSGADGCRLIACDGSDLRYAANSNELENYFTVSEQARGYNLLHLNALFDLDSRRYVDALVQPRRQADEIGAFISMIDRFPFDERVIFTADRGYESYNVIAHIAQRNMHYLIRVKQPMSSGILRALKLPHNSPFDLDFHIVLTRKQTKQVKANHDLYRILDKATRFDFCDLEYQLFYPLDFRVVSVEIAPGVWEYLITNLDRDSFSPSRLKVLYHHRWGIENAFRDLKHTIGLEHFHSKRAEFIAQEVFARLILYNLCELVASHAAIFGHTASGSHVYQLNFSAAVHIVRHALFFLKPDDPPPDVVSLIRKYLLPVRPNRSNPRKVGFRSAVSFLYRVA